ncbi:MULTISPECIES: ABC transporter permease [Salinibaculum]|uniref:ABC transporter permease n=1 Tax=Salinibaculum TaxID=2732368 RepID=UPI0030CD05B3
MSTKSQTRFGRTTIGRGSLVAGFIGLQTLAFAAAYSVGQPTLYAYFLVLSAMGVAYLYESDETLLRAGSRFLAVQVAAVVATAVLGTIAGPVLGVLLEAMSVVVSLVPGFLDPVVGVLEALVRIALPFARLPWFYVGVVVLGTAGAVVTTDEGGFTVGAVSFGSVLVVALGLPLFLFVARQAPDLVVEKAMDPDVHRVLYLGVYGPLLAAVLSLLFGVPLAYLLARGFPGQQFVESLVDLPLVVPHSVAGIIILFGFGQGGAFPEVSVLGSIVGMVLAMTFVSAPYAVNTTREAFEAIDDRLEYASRIHGANEWQTFRRVTGPLAVRGMITGGVLAWARAVSEFGAVAVVAYSVSFFYPFAGGEVTAQHAPVFVYNTYLQGGLGESGAVAFLLLAVSALIFLVVRYLTDDDTVIGGVP